MLFTEAYRGRKEMSVLIQNKKATGADAVKKENTLPSEVLRIIPKHIVICVEALCRSGMKIDEIRLRAGEYSSVTVGNKNIFLNCFVSEKDIECSVIEACDGSPYAYVETIKKGYITISGGIRIGICGRASVEKDRIIGVRNISGLNIRIPSYKGLLGRCVADKLLEIKRNGGGGALVYSPPGEGKTTLLRCLASHLSSGENALRVVVVDTRDELAVFNQSVGRCIDVLSGYPKAEGIEIATRTMNAEIIICDEIGSKDDVEAILFAQNCGVPLLASAHGGSIEGILRRGQIEKLHRACAFDTYVGISKPDGGGEYSYTFTSREEANAIVGL